jgi:hypothetical protein
MEFTSVHRGSVLIEYRLGKEDGGAILGQTGLNLLLTVNSGHSFSQRTEISPDPRFRSPVTLNGSTTTPWFVQLDGRIDRAFSLGPIGLDIYLYAINLLGSDNAVNVFPGTGDPSDNGWFSTPGGATTGAQLGPQYVAFSNAVLNGKNSGNWGPPRQIRFGVRLEY